MTGRRGVKGGGWVIGARTGDPVAIAAHIGKGRVFDEAMGAFANAYADQTERDHRQLVDAPGW